MIRFGPELTKVRVSEEDDIYFASISGEAKERY